jgi:ribosomal protein S18 acetylase RimI-like enzyme
MTATKATLVSTRYIESQDQARILELEALNHLFPAADEPSLSVKDSRQMSRSDILEFVERERTRAVVLVAGSEKTIEGFLLVDASDRDRTVIHRLSVSEKRRGFGSALLIEAEGIARRAGTSKLVAYVYEQDVAAQNFFKARGFASKVVRRHFDGKQAAVEFVKQV